MFPPVAPGGVICAFGELVQDQICVLTDELVAEGLVDGRLSWHRGGCAPNALAIAASLGSPARFLGHFGADAVSSSLADQLQRSGVRIFGVRRGRGSSSLCIELPGGGTSLVFDPADSRSMRPSDIRSWWLEDAAVLHLNSNNLYASETAPAFWRLVELAQEKGVPISLDTSSSNQLRDFGVDCYRDAIRRVRPAVLMCNEAEGDVLGVLEDHPEGAAVVIEHRGPKPTVVQMASGDPWEVEVPHVGNVVETVAAGDVFAGGFLVGWAQQRSLRGAVELAHEVAARSVQGFGVDVLAEKGSGTTVLPRLSEVS